MKNTIYGDFRSFSNYLLKIFLYEIKKLLTKFKNWLIINVKRNLRGSLMHKNERAYLSDEELAVLAANGDDESMALLIAKVAPIASAKASSFAKARIPDEDLTQEGMLGFLDAVKTFNPQNGAPFKAYAETCINNRIVSAVRVSFNNKNAALSNAVAFEDDGADIGDLSSDPANIVSQNDESEYYERLLNDGLSEFEYKGVMLRLENKSYADVSKELGCSEKAVDNALQRIKKKMRAKLNK